MKKIFFGIAIILTSLASCNTDPEACFTVSKNNDVKINEEVHFNASCSEYSETYNWNFGDGGTAEGAEVKHKYSSEGTYEVSLTALNSGQSSVTSARVIVVK